MSPSVLTRLIGFGSYAPDNSVDNLELCRKVDTSDEWIRARTGISSRHIAHKEQPTSELAFRAAEIAISSSGLQASEIDLVIVATITPDMAFPSTACLLQHKLGLSKVACFDLEAACSGFLYALDVADAMLTSGRYRNALVVGAEKMSSIMDWEDRTTCVLFGDGAGAAILSKAGSGPELLGFVSGADGSNPSLLCQPGGGSANPASVESIENRLHFLKMNGREIFKLAVRVMESSARELLDKNGISIDQIEHVIPHQANVRIVESLSQRLGIPMNKFFCNLERFGNTSAASIPLAFDEGLQKGIFKKDSLGLMVAFGAGLTWSSTLVRF